MAEATDCMAVLKFQILTCFQLLDKFSWLLDAYVLNFFTENHIGIVPKSWKTCMQQISLDEFQYVLNSSSNIVKSVWPLSVICLKELVHYLSLLRKIEDKHKALLFCSNNIALGVCDFSKTLNQPKVYNLFLKHVKPKKRYEIFKIAHIAQEKARKLNVNFVVDVGSGLGHLSRILAYGFHLKVCSIETQPQLVAHAEKLDCEFEKIAEKYLSLDEVKLLKDKRPVRWNQTITSDLSPDEFFLHLKWLFGVKEEELGFGIVGLHPCGDLATVLLNLFVGCRKARFISVVGCCYHKLSTTRDENNSRGFPISLFSIENKIRLSYEARALACHAIENYCHRLNSKAHYHLKIHCYRAVLEKLIHKNWPHHQKKALANVKPNPDLSFEQYCSIALNKLNVEVSKENLEGNEVCQNLSEWEYVAKFYTFRLMLAPLIETLILLDRKLYLLEKGITCEIIAAFDPEVSPRNQLLISEKN